VLFHDTASQRCQHLNASYASPGSVSRRLPASAIEKDTIMANSNFPEGWFYIQSPLTDNIGRTLAANVQGSVASPGAQIIVWPLQPNSYNTLWQFKNGTIASALGNQELVLDTSYVAPNTWVVLNSANGSSSQQWTFNSDTGTISNQGGLVLDINTGSAYQGAWLNVDSAAQRTSQQWSLISPQVFMPTWSYIQSGLPVGPNDPPLVATIQAGTSSVVLSPMQANSSNQLWQITPDGRILSATGGNPVMTLGSQLSGGQNGNYIVTAPSPAKTDSTLQWVFNDQSMFINVSGGLALNVEGGSANPNTSLITYAVQDGPPENEVWSISPACPLTGIMAEPPVAFPVFTGDQGIAYTSICQQLGVTDLRSEYTNLSVDLGSTYLTPLESGKVKRPQGVTPADWKTVVTQLENELTAATNVQRVFAQYTDFHTALFPTQSSVLSQLVTDAGMDQGSDPPKVGGIVLSVLEGVLYTGLEAVPGVGAAAKTCAVLGNVMMGGINIGMSVANRGGGSISPDPFQVAVSELQGQLNQNFQALLTAMGNMEETILTDWGKMQATYSDILSTGPDSLAWDATLTANLITAAQPGYTISVMQMLLPAKYQIFQYQANDGSPISGPDSKAQWVQWIGTNTWSKYWIASPGNWNEYPSDQAMDDVWNSGASASDFFQGLAGWGFARCYPSKQGPIPGVDCNGLVITITNQTPNPLTVDASPNNGQGVTVNGPSSQTLQPYGSVSFVGYYTNELAIDITITDPNLAGAGSVASFTAHQNNCVMAAGDVTVDQLSTSLGYQLTAPICNSGSFANSFPGAVQIGICLAPIND
jgi:hypothetical protein